jgi:hypothetical protein
MNYCRTLNYQITSPIERPQQMASDSKPDLRRSIMRTRAGGIADFFLRAKHWQIFLLFIALECVGTVATIIMNFMRVSPEILAKLSLPLAVVSVLTLGFYLAWLWFMGSFLASIVPLEFRVSTALFRFTLIWMALYSISLLPFLRDLYSVPKPIHVALYLFGILCWLNSLYFVANNLVEAETGKPTGSFLDYAGPFFLLWISLIGVWFIQPRINRLYAQRITA